MDVGHNIFFITLSLLCFFIFVVGETSTCTMKETCQECLRDSSDCQFCASASELEQKRCQPKHVNMTVWCDKIENPENFINADLNDDFISNEDRIIQIKPQLYKIKLRPGRKQPFEFSFQAVQNFPVDIYFLLDTTTSMKKMRAKVMQQSGDIYKYFQGRTKNIYLGLGSFVDKSLFPMTDKFNSSEAYSFTHHLQLGSDYMKFNQTFNDLPTGVNKDRQEGGLDALAQVITCNNIIGWRSDSRKIIVYLSNSPYHAAGHGQFAGLTQPYDGRCYTDASSNYTYTKEKIMDYPTVGMIDHLVAKHDINIFFLVASNMEIVYKALSGSVRGSVYSVVNSKNGILSALSNIYEKKSTKIKLNVNMNSVANRKNFEINIEPNCAVDLYTKDCEIETGKEKKFNGVIKLKKYTDGLDDAFIDINIEGSSARLTLDIEVIKNCECENTMHVEENSKYCHSEKRICGVCHCSEKRYGKNCICTAQGVNKDVSKDSITKPCKPSGSDIVCNGYGACFCGKCICDKGYTGQYCECSTADCPKNQVNQTICSDHGDCQCDKTCHCQPGWKGAACDCTLSEETCKAFDGTICNNRGECNCGVCDPCDPYGIWDARHEYDKYCQVLPCQNCHDLQCQKLEQCASCVHQESDDCIPDCTNDIIATVNDTIEEQGSWKKCSKLIVGVGCYTSFVYRYKTSVYGLELIVQRGMNCAEIGIISGCIILGTLLLVGLGTLLAWKLITSYKDRKEYMRFCRQNGLDANTGVLENPIYSSPSTTVHNPAFRKRSYRN